MSLAYLGPLRRNHVDLSLAAVDILVNDRACVLPQRSAPAAIIWL